MESTIISVEGELHFSTDENRWVQFPMNEVRVVDRIDYECHCPPMLNGKRMDKSDLYYMSQLDRSPDGVVNIYK